ncbi:hypothetical protein J6590_021544 [Homalodisca vitripennis]|nr:hypothetical protein J6590_021544 [Homalodisca vitripennis]
MFCRLQAAGILSRYTGSSFSVRSYLINISTNLMNLTLASNWGMFPDIRGMLGGTALRELEREIGILCHRLLSFMLLYSIC